MPILISGRKRPLQDKKRIGNKIYGFYSSYKDKTRALTEAKRLRSIGRLARVEKVSLGKGYIYAIFTHWR